MNFTISKAAATSAEAHTGEVSTSLAGQAKLTERLLALPYTPLSHQAYLAAKVQSGSWNRYQFFNEGREVSAKISRCYFSAIDFLVSEQRLIGAFLGSLLAKKSEQKQNRFDLSSCRSLRDRIVKQRHIIEISGSSLCFATFARIVLKNDKVLVAILQGQEANGTQFIVVASNKLSHIQRFKWRRLKANDSNFLPLIFKKTPFEAVDFYSWHIGKNRILKSLDKLPAVAAERTETTVHLPPWANGIWVHVDLRLARLKRPLPLYQSAPKQTALLRRIDYWMQYSLTELAPYGLQLQTMHEIKTPLAKVLEVATSPDSLITHCKLNALGLAARILGPMTACESLKDVMVTRFNVFEEELKAFGSWVLNAKNQERGALVLFYLKGATLRGRNGEIATYGSHLFLIMLTAAEKRSGVQDIAYNVYGSYLFKYRIRQLKKPLAIGESSLNSYEFNRRVLDPLKTILHGKEWTPQHDDSYFNLFNVRKPDMLLHSFETEMETKTPIDAMSFKAAIIPFRVKGRGAIRREEREWAMMNPWLDVNLYSVETYDRFFPHRSQPHFIRMKPF